MENASKALLFAAGILIAIILISVAVYIVSMSNDATKNVGSTISDMELSSFNSKFTTYEGVRTGSQVKALVETVNSSNSNNSNTDLLVELEIGKNFGTSTPKLTGTAEGGDYALSVGSSKKYQIEIEKESGAVKKITINGTEKASSTQTN